MLEQLIRPKFQRYCVQPFLPWLASRFKPEQVTFFALMLGIAVLPALYLNQAYVAVFLLMLSGYVDCLDGSVARVNGLSSNKGAVLDIMADRMVEVAIVIGLWLVEPLSRSFSCLLLLASFLLCITSFLVVGIFSQVKGDKSFYYSPGLIERAEAFLFFIAMILLPHWFNQLALLLSVLTVITAAIRTYQFMRQS